MNERMVKGACPLCGAQVQFESEYSMMEMKCPGCAKPVKFRVVGRVKKEPEPVAPPMSDGPVGVPSRPSRYAAGRKAMAWLVVWGKIQVWLSILAAVVGPIFYLPIVGLANAAPTSFVVKASMVCWVLMMWWLPCLAGFFFGVIFQGLADVGHAVMDLAEQRAEPGGKRGSL